MWCEMFLVDLISSIDSATLFVFVTLALAIVPALLVLCHGYPRGDSTRVARTEGGGDPHMSQIRLVYDDVDSYGEGE